LGRLGALLLLLCAGAPAPAVIIASGDGTGNTTAPPRDPGWANVGLRGSVTAVYLGNGWVLTANHVGVGSVSFQGVTYEAIPESKVRFDTAPGQVSELIVFRVRGEPALPALELAASPPEPGTPVILIGNGRSRGTPTLWNGIRGWNRGAGASLRWGTNRVEEGRLDVAIHGTRTRAFSTEFAPDRATLHEAQAAVGDSGGAAFVERGDSWELAGLVFAVDSFDGQPPGTTLYGNRTLAADLSFYRRQIQAVVRAPACRDGLDNDGDGRIDYPRDPGCKATSDASEAALPQPGSAVGKRDAPR
jgi:hypothetical protein